jgi:hypothetical protein
MQHQVCLFAIWLTLCFYDRDTLDACQSYLPSFITMNITPEGSLYPFGCSWENPIHALQHASFVQITAALSCMFS